MGNPYLRSILEGDQRSGWIWWRRLNKLRGRERAQPVARRGRRERGDRPEEAGGKGVWEKDLGQKQPKYKEGVFNLFSIYFNWLNELCVLKLDIELRKFTENFREYSRARRILQKYF